MPERHGSPVALEVVTDPRRAVALMHPIRLRILHQAAAPTSATQAANRLGLSRQRVNHHFRHLVESGFLRPAGRRRRRNMVEKLYLASAAGYLLSPDLLGPARADWRGMAETRSGAYLLALLANAQADLAPAGAPKAARPTETLSLKTQFRLEGEREREEFAAALRSALSEVVTRYTRPAAPEQGSPPAGRLHRMVVACYPYAPGPAANPER
jgi:hypothetical protein